MQPDALARQQIGVDGLAQQRMPERIPLLAIRHQQLMRDGFADGLLILLRSQSRRLPDQLVVRPPPA